MPGGTRLRVRIFVGVIAGVLTLFLLRAGQLQLVDAAIYSGTSQENSVRTRLIEPPRGLIYDRDGRLLVDNEPSFTIQLTPVFFDTTKIDLLARLLDEEPSTVRERLEEARAWSPYRASRAFREVPDSIFSRVQENQYRLPGVDYVVDERRRYHGPNAAHVLGYVKEITERQLANLRDEGYRPGDRIGQAGVERAYNEVLRGRRGREFRLVNVHGQEVGAYRDGTEDIPPESGSDLHLTIDSELQALAESLMVHKQGAVIALDPRDGDILSLVSTPTYDPARLAGKVEASVWRRLQSNPQKPLFNRVTMSEQPPGSTFKPFMALAALEEGAITVQTQQHCPGAYYYHGQKFRCHGPPHGSISVEEALMESCNTFFFKTMMRLNFARWHAWGDRFGFGRAVPTDLPDQATGVLPDSAYFDRTYGEGRWTRGYLVSLGIGQGNLGVTPLQLGRYAGALANGGTLHPPHVVERIVDPETGESREPEIGSSRTLSIEDEHMRVVREGMRRLVAEKNVFLQWNGPPAGGKTGTAQNPHGEDHAWFIGYAPFDDPTIAVAILVEHGGFGASVSAPMAGLLIEQHLKGGIADNRQWVYDYVQRQRSKTPGDSTVTASAGSTESASFADSLD